MASKDLQYLFSKYQLEIKDWQWTYQRGVGLRQEYITEEKYVTLITVGMVLCDTRSERPEVMYPRRINK